MYLYDHVEGRVISAGAERLRAPVRNHITITRRRTKTARTAAAEQTPRAQRQRQTTQHQFGQVISATAPAPR
jgi:hypothetical protein